MPAGMQQLQSNSDMNCFDETNISCTPIVTSEMAVVAMPFTSPPFLMYTQTKPVMAKEESNRQRYEKYNRPNREKRKEKDRDTEKSVCKW